MGALTKRLNSLCEVVKEPKSTMSCEKEVQDSEEISNELSESAIGTSPRKGLPSSEPDIELTTTQCKNIQYNIRNVNIEKPKFGDKAEIHPVSFLEDLGTYLRKASKEGEELDLIQECLCGDAKDWARIYKGRWKRLTF